MTTAARLSSTLALGLAVLAACVGGDAFRASKPSASPHAAPPASSLSASADYGAPASGGDTYSRPSSTATSPQPAPTERPGLGTVWGETVSSHVSTKPFERYSSSPFAAVTVHYNDAEGVDAQARYLGGVALQPLRAYTPNGGVSVALVDQNGALLPGGQMSGRTLVVGAEGQRYNIIIDNRTGGRYEVVASVDGLDVIDGHAADLHKRGYIIEPYSNLVIDGFRQSDDTVAAFRFGRVSDSYAARTSGDRNVGIVGVALFAERGSRWTTDELERRDSANPFPGDRAYARPPG